MSLVDPAVLVTAAMAGLLGSGHCFGMCGGIATGLGSLRVTTSTRQGGNWLAAWQFNGGRLLSYAVLGSVAGLLLGTLSNLADIGRYLRLLTALMIAAIGLRFLFNWRGLDFIERAGAGLWQRIMPAAQRAGQRRDGAGRVALGLCWGLLPCGLVYTLLLTAASTGSALNGALTMLAFGLGTLPSMLGMTVAAPALAAFLRDANVRRVIGFALLLLAAWSWLLAWPAKPAAMPHNHHFEYNMTDPGSAA